MATVTGLTAERMAEIVAASIMSGEVVGNDLILTRYDEATVNAGNVRGPQGLQGIQGVDGADGAPGPEGPPGDLYPRATANITTASLLTDASESGLITLALSYRILKIETSRAARVRLYTTAAKRTSDIPRLRSVDPTGDHGLVGEWITESGDLIFEANPCVIASNLESVPSTSIPIHITNLGDTGAVTVTFTYQQME